MESPPSKPGIFSVLLSISTLAKTVGGMFAKTLRQRASDATS